MFEIKSSTSQPSAGKFNSSTSSTKKRIAIVTTHPIQYNAPLFRYLAQLENIALKVFYSWGKDSIHVFDPGFGKERAWDIDLLSGYEYVFVNNVSKNPGSHHYKGIVNPDLIHQVSDFNADAIIIYGWKFHSHLKVMRYFKGKVPILFRGDSTLLDEPITFSFKKQLRQLLLKWVYRHVDIALSPGTASDAYFRHVGLKDHQIVRAPHAIDNERFGETEKRGNGETRNWRDDETENWRLQLGIPSDAITYLFAGKFEPKKNPLLLIKAFKKLYETHKNIHLILVGDGVLKGQIEHELKFSTFNPKLSTLIPFQNQSVMPSVYRLGDVFVLPSQGPGETWGLALNEAMACGRAVIASDKCGGAKDLIESRKNGYVFESGNLENLVEKMKLCLEGNRYLSMGGYSAEKIKEFSYNSFWEELNSILQ